MSLSDATSMITSCRAAWDALQRSINEVRRAGSGAGLVRRRSDWSGYVCRKPQRSEIA